MKNKFTPYLFINRIGIILLIVLFSCTNEKNTSEINKLRNNLIGKWGGLDESGPGFSITFDSIYYYDQGKSYSYEFINGDMVINFLTYKGGLRQVAVVKDTMFFLDEFPDTIRAYRYH